MKDCKYIFLVGGVMSGIGKGISASSFSVLLSNNGYKVNNMKIDPYLNIDAGTMNPIEHGEVFVLDSGLETDQDMGNYERFLDKNLSDEDYATGGMVYKELLDKEREGRFGGRCVEAYPHLIDHIKDKIVKSRKKAKADIQIIEIGGTIGDYQNALFFEAARQLQLENNGNVLFVLVSYLPYPKMLGEVKTRPTQNAVRSLNSYGIHPNIILARTEVNLDKKRLEKIATSCNISKENIVMAIDVKNIYDIPLKFYNDNVDKILLKELALNKKKSTGLLNKWKKIQSDSKKNKKTVRIAIVGKYFNSGNYTLSDSYLSVIESIKFASVKNKCKPDIEWINSEEFKDKKKLAKLKDFDAVIVPGGFGPRGVDGKREVISYARKNNIPILGICLGMQLMVIEFMRNVVGKRKANSVEFDKDTKDPVVTFVKDQREKLAEKKYGGSMRLGGYMANIQKGTLLRELYGKGKVVERHRHRYEINNDYIDVLEENGMTVSAYSNTGLVEAVEIQDHPFFVGVQFHPEFTSRPFSPNPLFDGLIKAALKKK